MVVFIRGLGIISAQHTFNTNEFLSELVSAKENRLNSINPQFKDFINPILVRRMGRIIKMGIAAASVCLKDAKIEMPDAIMTGTALGCLEDTENFLMALIENEEQFLTPTSFIQSTHNTVSAQIALQLKCMNYNFTYVHKGFSFESALLDGMMTLAEGNAKNILVGGHDEMTDKYFRVCDRIGYWKKEVIESQELINSTTSGSVAGEGAAFFVLSSEKSNTDYAVLKGIKSIYKPGDVEEIAANIKILLKEHKLVEEDIDLVIYGINGDSRFDPVYHELRKSCFSNSDAAWYKHLSGEYQTSASFALWLAAKILKTQTIPQVVCIGEVRRQSFNNILILNGFLHSHYTAFLVSACN